MRPRPRPIVVRPAQTGLSFELVRSLHDRSARDANGLFLAEGARFLHAAIDHEAAFAGIVICPPRLHGSLLREEVTRVERAGVPLLRASPTEYRELSTGTSDEGENVAAGQGVLLVLRQRWETLPSSMPPDALWIGVESVRSDGNLGTLLRSGDAAGATGMVVFDRSEAGTPSGADPYAPSSVRASMGAIFAHRFLRATHRRFRRAAGDLLVVGATGEATQDYRTVDYRAPTLLMLGDERAGLSPGQRATCHRLARIPMAGSPDSLNLAMAGTLMLYEAYRQRHPIP